MGKNIDDIIDHQLDLQPDKSVDDLLRRELTKEAFHEDSTLNMERKEREAAGISHGAYKYKDPLEYTAEEFVAFKKKIGEMISKDGICCRETLTDTVAKNYIANYVQKNFYEDKKINALRRLQFKLTYLSLGGFLKDGSKVTEQFPVITEWQGHFLVRVTYFKKTLLGIEACIVPVKTASIILT